MAKKTFTRVTDAKSMNRVKIGDDKVIKLYSGLQREKSHEIQTSSKIYRCAYCEKVFARKSNCTLQERVH